MKVRVVADLTIEPNERVIEYFKSVPSEELAKIFTCLWENMQTETFIINQINVFKNEEVVEAPKESGVEAVLDMSEPVVSPE